MNKAEAKHIAQPRNSRIENEIRYGNATKHSMTRRCEGCDYHQGHRGYMFTLRVEEGKPLFGRIAGSLEGYAPAAPLHVVPAGVVPASRAGLLPATWSQETDRALTAFTSLTSVPVALTTVAPAGPHVVLTELGAMVLQIWLSMRERYSLDCAVYDTQVVVMPDHFHAILHVKRDMEKHLSDLERAFKGACNAAYRLLLAEGRTEAVGTARQWLAALHAAPADKQAEMREWLHRAYLRSATFAARCASEPSSAVVSSAVLPSTWSKETVSQAGADIGEPPVRLPGQGKHPQVGFLFVPNYVDTFACYWDDQLEKKIEYIRYNPYTRLQRTSNRSAQFVKRGAVDTCLMVPALFGYLRRECGSKATDEALADIGNKLITRPSTLAAAEHPSTRSKETGQARSKETGLPTVRCDSYGALELLGHRLLPVVCHRKDAGRFLEQREKLLAMAREQGAVLVSARIAKGEQDIMDAATAEGLPVIRLLLEGFRDKYHPSQELNDLCDAGKLLLLTPWQWCYKYAEDAISVPLCKTLNCIVQSICHTKDGFWKECLRQ